MGCATTKRQAVKFWIANTKILGNSALDGIVVFTLYEFTATKSTNRDYIILNSRPSSIHI